MAQVSAFSIYTYLNFLPDGKAKQRQAFWANAVFFVGFVLVYIKYQIGYSKKIKYIKVKERIYKSIIVGYNVSKASFLFFLAIN